MSDLTHWKLAPSKPCPFCGGTDIKLVPLKRYFLSCVTCGADGPETTSTELETTSLVLKLEAEKLWEQRAP